MKMDEEKLKGLVVFITLGMWAITTLAVLVYIENPLLMVGITISIFLAWCLGLITGRQEVLNEREEKGR